MFFLKNIFDIQQEFWKKNMFNDIGTVINYNEWYIGHKIIKFYHLETITYKTELFRSLETIIYIFNIKYKFKLWNKIPYYHTLAFF